MLRHAIRAAALLLILPAAAAAADDTPKAISDAIRSLEKAHAEARDPAEKSKLADAVAALKKVSAARKIQNELISGLVDDREKFVGRALTFRLTYTGAVPLNQLKPGSPATFTGEDPKNGAKLNLKAFVPRGVELKFPAAKDGDEVVVTFTVADKSTNLIDSVTRP